MAETPVVARPGEALVWTDGACCVNPGPGGWAAIVVPPDGGELVELSRGEPHSTNNRRECRAAVCGVRSRPAGSRGGVVTGAVLRRKAMAQWITRWKRRGWRTAGGGRVKSQDLVLGAEAEI